MEVSVLGSSGLRRGLSGPGSMIGGVLPFACPYVRFIVIHGPWSPQVTMSHDMSDISGSPYMWHMYPMPDSYHMPRMPGMWLMSLMSDLPGYVGAWARYPACTGVYQAGHLYPGTYGSVPGRRGACTRMYRGARVAPFPRPCFYEYRSNLVRTPATIGSLPAGAGGDRARPGGRCADPGARGCPSGPPGRRGP